MREDALNQVGNIPFTPSVLLCLFPKTKQISDKARYLEQDGRIIRLKRGLYVRSAEDGAMPVPSLIANHLYGPSYVSFQTALRHYGLYILCDFPDNILVNKRVCPEELILIA